MLINGQECRVITVRAGAKIVYFYCPNDWATNDVTSISSQPRGDFPASNTKSYTGFVTYGNVKFPVTGCSDRHGNTIFHLMPQEAMNHYDRTQV